VRVGVAVVGVPVAWVVVVAVVVVAVVVGAVVSVDVVVTVVVGSSVDALDATDPDAVGGDGVPVSSANAIGVTSIPAIAKVAATALPRRPMWIVFMLSPVVTAAAGPLGARARASFWQDRTVSAVLPANS
jgi:hypothetical protein